MTKSELKEIIRETILTEMETGYSNRYPGGKTPGLTKKVMDTILMNIAKGTVPSEEEKPKETNEDVRFDFQNTTGGGGRRFIPNQGIIPSSMFNDKDFMLNSDGNKIYMDPLLVNAIVNSKTLTNRAAKVRYIEFKGKMGPHFQQFKKGLEGRLSKVVKGGKPYEVWNGKVMTNKKGQVVFPYNDIGTFSENLKK